MLRDVVLFLLLPPMNLAVLAAGGLALAWRGPRSRIARTGRWLAASGLAGLLLLATHAVSGSLLVSLESGLPAPPPDAAPEAIVILGGDAIPLWPVLEAGPQPGVVQDIGTLSLERLRGGAALARATQLPVLITGAALNDGLQPVAVLMARALRQDFDVPVRWIEPGARNTWENARNAAALLRAAGIRSAYVVTHAWHMRRTLIAFRGTGLVAVPAPLGLHRPPLFRSGDFVPSERNWLRSYYALHEWIGCAAYAWRARGA